MLMTQKNNSSGQPGVFFKKKTGRWVAMIGFHKRRIYLGEHDTVEKAIEVRKAAEKKYHGKA